MKKTNKYRVENAIVEAIQWFKNGDHPQDNCQTCKPKGGRSFKSEGEIVRYYRTPDLDGKLLCSHCGNAMHYHGWVENADQVVCPGDWVVTGITGKLFVCKPDYFEENYKKIDEGLNPITTNMGILAHPIRITPVCTKNHGIENRVDYAFELIREHLIKSLEKFPDKEIVVGYCIKHGE